ncbi:hypothetical protein PORCRE_1755 [Porphyromonas crevioricanis JCM 15906]|uniref:Uncharacterized protein n=1 Tax=Porphyromonas crevioricanis JCM 15906 TaxID=1305617 RepID=T1DT62_9PORP|nr:hypothetical protein PORCRE_1755 [Porphyromonas crevioricanis JCM 15906]
MESFCFCKPLFSCTSEREPVLVFSYLLWWQEHEIVSKKLS